MRPDRQDRRWTFAMLGVASALAFILFLVFAYSKPAKSSAPPGIIVLDEKSGCRLLQVNLDAFMAPRHFLVCGLTGSWSQPYPVQLR